MPFVVRGNRTRNIGLPEVSSTRACALRYPLTVLLREPSGTRPRATIGREPELFRVKLGFPESRAHEEIHAM